MMKTYKILLSFFLILMSGFGLSQSVPSYVPTNGLVGWWGFNGNAQDGSGNGNHGTVNGATLTTDRFGNQNGAYDFDGVNDNIIYSQINIINLSISIWFKTDSGIQTNLNYGHPPIGAQLIGQGTQHGNNVTYSDFAFGISSYNNSNLFFSFEKSNIPSFQHSDYNLGNATNFLNSWNHGILTVNNNYLKFYVNGLLYSLDTLIFPIGFSNAPLSIGSRFVYQAFSGDGYCNFFKGKLDDIGIWNRALSQQEITNLYNSQLPAQTSLCLPTITTSSPSSVGVDSVVIGGDISNDGGSSIVLRGVCYSTSTNPNMGNQRTEDGSGIGSFNTVLRGLTSSTTYYARSYAKNFNGVVVYGNEVSFTTSASLPGVRCPGTPTVTDIDGNIYNTVQIGNQCWIQSNLKVSKYRNGDGIPTGLSNSAWENATSGAYAIYNNDPVNDGLFGKLYNHYAVTDSRGLCPTGWHVPSDTDWTILGNQFGGSALAGSALKSTLSQPIPGGWPLPNSGASNSSGFSAIPGGLIGNNGLYYSGNSDGYWWTTTFGYLWGGLSRVILENGTGLLPNHTYHSFGMSVRCLKSTLPQVNTTSVTNVTPSTTLVTGEVISEGDQNTVRGFCYSTTSNPTISNNTTMNGTGIGVYSDTLQNLTPLTTYYVRAYATNSLGTSYGNEVVFTSDSLPGVRCPGTPTVTDIDGNIYNTVQIGNQCWTQSNLKVSKYRNGDTIPTGLSNSDWQNTTSGAYAIYNNDPVNDGLYGKLYNHYTVTDSRGLCPTGWHVPTDREWMTLESHLGGASVAGGPLKSTAMQPTPGGWNPPNTGASNSSGFTALPCGVRSDNGDFYGVSYSGYWWSSSVSSVSNAWTRVLFSFNSDFFRNYHSDNVGFSVRCLKNTLPQVNTTSVTNVTPSTALVTGEVISEGGDQNTTRGFCYSITPNPTISNDTTMNGTGTGVYTGIIPNLNPSTTYYVRAYATNSLGSSYGNEVIFSTNTSNGFSSCGAVSDIDGNNYQTVLIGSQCWTQSNLRTSRYINGDSVVTGLSDTSWSTTNQGAFVISQYPSDFGFYYNHYAAIDSRGICPTGWRIPSETDWNLLINFVDNLSDTGCINWCEQSAWGAMSLKNTSSQGSPANWNSAYVGGAGTNSSGFSSLPAGGISTMGHFMIVSSGRWTNYWSTSLINMPNVPTRMLVSDNHKIFKAHESQNYGYSVRCIKN